MKKFSEVFPMWFRKFLQLIKNQSLTRNDLDCMLDAVRCMRILIWLPNLTFIFGNLGAIGLSKCLTESPV